MLIILSFLLGTLLLILGSYLLFNNIRFHYILVTLFILTCPIPFLAYSQAWIIEWYVLFLYIIIFLAATNKLLKKINLLSWLEFKKRFITYLNKLNASSLYIIVTLILTVLFTYKLQPFTWRFEAHDLVYYSWLNEIFRVDYIGPLRVSTAYPHQLSANHLTAGSILTPFLFLIRPINMYSAYTIKFGLVFISFFNYIYSYINAYFSFQKEKNNSNLIVGVILLIIPTFIFMPEIDFSLSISSYAVIFCLLGLGSLVLDKYYEVNNTKQKNILDKNLIIIFLISSLLISKASTLPTFTLSIIFLCLNYSFSTLKYKILDTPLFGLLISPFILIVSILSWVIPRSNHGGFSLSSPFCLISNPEQNGIDCITSFFANPFKGWLISGDLKIEFLTNFPLFSNNNILVFFYIWFIAILPCFCVGKILSKYSSNDLARLFGNFSYFYSLATSFSVVFLRESSYFSGAQTAHSYLIAPCFTFIGICLIFVEFIPTFKFKMIIFLPLVILIANLINFNYHNISTMTSRRKTMDQASRKIIDRISLTNYESSKFDTNYCTSSLKEREYFGRFLNEEGCGDNNFAEIKDALEGQRSNVSLNASRSLIKQWALIEKE